MTIQDLATKDVKIYRIKTAVYDIDYYHSTGAHWQFEPASLQVNSSVTEIERSDFYYETDDKNNKLCHVPDPQPRTKVPFPIQNCNCFKFAEGNPPTGTPLNPTSPLYTDKFEKCVFFDYGVGKDPGLGDYHFYLTIWTKTEQEEPACGDFQVVGVSLSQILQTTKSHSTEQVGQPFQTNNIVNSKRIFPFSGFIFLIK